MSDFFHGWVWLAAAAIATIAWAWSKICYEAVTFPLRKRQHRIESWNGYLAWYRWSYPEAKMYNLWKRLPPNAEQAKWAALERMELNGIDSLKEWRIPYWAFVVGLSIPFLYWIFWNP